MDASSVHFAFLGANAAFAIVALYTIFHSQHAEPDPPDQDDIRAMIRQELEARIAHFHEAQLVEEFQQQAPYEAELQEHLSSE